MGIVLPWGLSDKDCACNVGDTGSGTGSGRSPGERNGNPLEYISRYTLQYQCMTVSVVLTDRMETTITEN